MADKRMEMRLQDAKKNYTTKSGDIDFNRWGAVSLSSKSEVDALKKYYQQQQAAAQTAANEKTYAEQISELDDSTVSNRLQKSAGAAGLSDKQTQDVLKGTRFGEAVLGEEGLGRLGTDPEVSATLQRFKDISEQGLSRQEVAAERAQAFRGIESATQTGLRSLQSRLAKSGVKGSAAGMALLQREAAGAQQKAQTEQNLFLKSEQLKREGLKDYSSRLGEVKTFDLGQAAAEKDIVMQSGLGFAQIGSAERTAKYAAEQSRLASVAAARAGRPRCFTGDNLVEDANGEMVRFEDLKPGMLLKEGNVVTGVSCHMALDDLYEYNGVKVTGCHYVFDNKRFRQVKNTKEAKSIQYAIDEILVYNVFTSTGLIDVNGQLFSDYDDDSLREMDEEISQVSQREVQ